MLFTPVAILSPSLRSEPRFDDRRKPGDDDTDASRDPGNTDRTNGQRATEEMVADRAHEERQRPDEPPQQARFAARPHASG